MTRQGPVLAPGGIATSQMIRFAPWTTTFVPAMDSLPHCSLTLGSEAGVLQKPRPEMRMLTVLPFAAIRGMTLVTPGYFRYTTANRHSEPIRPVTRSLRLSIDVVTSRQAMPVALWSRRIPSSEYCRGRRYGNRTVMPPE